MQWSESLAPGKIILSHTASFILHTFFILKLNTKILCLASLIGLVIILAASCAYLPKSNSTVEPKYSHTEISTGKHYLAYRGMNDMSIEEANAKWLAKAEKLCRSRDFDHVLNKQEMRSKGFSKTKYPVIEGEIICPNV